MGNLVQTRVKELPTIAEIYEDWQDETGVKIIAISIDDARKGAKQNRKLMPKCGNMKSIVTQMAT